MRDRLTILVPLFILAQMLAAHWLTGDERLPRAPDLAHFPAEFSNWKELREDVIDPGVAAELQADQILSRTYAQRPGGAAAGLFVAWFQSQRGGARQPHSPKVCLPASGWVPQSTGELALDTTAGAIIVNRYVVAAAYSRAVVLYWYQTPRRVTAGEWSAKFWLVADALRDRRSDTALVRVVVMSRPGDDDAATAAASAFARDLYPLLRERLPR